MTPPIQRMVILGALGCLQLALVPASAGAEWSPSVTLSGPTRSGYAGDGRAAVDAGGNVTVVWVRATGSHGRLALEASYQPARRSFRRVQTVSSAGQDASAPALAADPRGGSVVVWQTRSRAGTSIRAARETTGGRFGAPARLATPGHGARAPDVSVDASGRAVVVWEQTTHSHPDRVRGAVLGVDGRFGVPLTLSARDHRIEESSIVAADYPEMSPRVAIGPHGELAAVWTRADGTSVRCCSEVEQARGELASQTFRPTRTLSSPTRYLGARSPSATFDSSGALLTGWVRRDGTSDECCDRTEVVFQPSSETTLAPEILSPPGRNGDIPVLAFDAAGVATAVWTETEPPDKAGCPSARVMAADRSRSESFGVARALSPLGEQADGTQLVIDRSGRRATAWLRGTGDFIPFNPGVVPCVRARQDVVASTGAGARARLGTGAPGTSPRLASGAITVAVWSNGERIQAATLDGTLGADPYPDIARPGVSAVRATPRTLWARSRRRRATVLSFRSTEPGRAVIEVYKPRRHGGPPLTVRLRLRARRGVNRVRFRGRTPSGALPPGRYALTAEVTDGAGNTGIGPGTRARGTLVVR